MGTLGLCLCPQDDGQLQLFRLLAHQQSLLLACGLLGLCLLWVAWLAISRVTKPGTPRKAQHEAPSAAPAAGAATAVASYGQARPQASAHDAIIAASYNRSISLEQRLCSQLLPKPLYSDLPKHCGKKLALVVDGDRATHVLIAGLLAGQPDFLVISVYSAEEALVLLQQLEYLPNTLLLGLELAGRGASGLQVCQIIRKAYSRVELPLIMLLPQDIHNSATEACIEAGANDWIVDPVGQAELLARLNTHIMLPQLVAAEADRYNNYALLQEMLPRRIIERLKTGSQVIAEQHEQVSILFSDICNFTTMSSEKPTEYIVNMLQELFSEFDACCDEHGVYKVETIGDAYMAVCGHDSACEDHALRMVNMATSMLQATERVGRAISHDLKIRVGIHTGPAYSGVVGTKCPRYCFFGDTVNTASRMESSSFPMCVHISDATKQALDEAWSLRSTGNSTDGALVGGSPREGPAHSWHGASSAAASSSDGASSGATDGHAAAVGITEGSRAVTFASEGGGGRLSLRSRALREPPRTVSLGARYQKGKGHMTSHLLLVGAYQEALERWREQEASAPNHGQDSSGSNISSSVAINAACGTTSPHQPSASKSCRFVRPRPPTPPLDLQSAMSSHRTTPRTALDGSVPCTSSCQADIANGAASDPPGIPAQATAVASKWAASDSAGQLKVKHVQLDIACDSGSSSPKIMSAPQLAIPSSGRECTPSPDQADSSGYWEDGHSGCKTPTGRVPPSPFSALKQLLPRNVADGGPRSPRRGSLLSSLASLEQGNGQLGTSSRVKRATTFHADSAPNGLPKIKCAPIQRSHTAQPESPYSQQQGASPGSVQADVQRAVEAALARMRDGKSAGKLTGRSPAR